MNIQTIQALDGRQYVLLPLETYAKIKNEIDSLVSDRDDCTPFVLSDYVDNPVALARIEARLTQEQLASLLSVSQAYISQVENLDHVKPELLERAKLAIKSASQ